jgi:hypothetical protein
MSDTSSSDRPASATSGNNDPRGRFIKENSVGHGNPFGRQAALRAELMACFSREDIRKIMAALMSQACNGDLAAARLVLGYIDADRCALGV